MSIVQSSLTLIECMCVRIYRKQIREESGGYIVAKLSPSKASALAEISCIFDPPHPRTLVGVLQNLTSMGDDIKGRGSK